MHCSQARRKLAEIDGQPADSELREHLQHCPQCAQLAQAARLLERACDVAGEDPLDLPSLATLRAGVERRLQTGISPARGITFMSALKQQLKARSRLGLGLGVAVVAILFLTLVPFKVEKTVGYEVAFGGVDERLALNETRFNEFLDQLGFAYANYDVSDCDKVCNVKVTNLKSEDDVRVLVAAFDKLNNVVVLKDVEPCKTEANCSVIELVGNSVLVGSNVSLTDDEIQKIVSIRLDSCSLNNIFVLSDEDNDGDSDVILVEGAGPHYITASCGDSLNQIELYLLDGQFTGPDGQNAGGTIEAILAKHGLTTDDMRGNLDEATIRELANCGITYNVVEDADGTKKIEIRVGSKESGGETHGNGDTEEAPLAKTAEPTLPEGYSLEQNYPNPFNPNTTIEYEIPTGEHVTLEIVNITGQVVRRLVDEYQGAGVHAVQWNATDDSGAKVASGVYLYRLSAGDFAQSKRMTLLK